MGGIMQVVDESPISALFQNAPFESTSSWIAAGTDKTMRNIMAGRMLKLPQEPRAYKNLPIYELKAETIRSGD